MPRYNIYGHENVQNQISPFPLTNQDFSQHFEVNVNAFYREILMNWVPSILAKESEESRLKGL